MSSWLDALRADLSAQGLMIIRIAEYEALKGRTTMKYRKKPVVIEAVHFLGDENLQECLDFIGGNCGGDDSRIAIETLEGVMQCSKGDWIIKGVKGEFYPCKPDIFEATYEAITKVE